MGKLRVLSGRAVMQILAGQGFVSVRQRGSHVVMQRRVGKSTVSVPVPDHTVLRTGTLRAIIRQSQLPRSLFEHP